MNFQLATTIKEFSDWLSIYYFRQYRVIPRFELETSDDGRQFFQYGTPKPPVVILAIYIKETDYPGIDIDIEPFDRPNNDLKAIQDCIWGLYMAAKFTEPPTSPPPTA